MLDEEVLADLASSYPQAQPVHPETPPSKLWWDEIADDESNVLDVELDDGGIPREPVLVTLAVTPIEIQPSLVSLADMLEDGPATLCTPLTGPELESGRLSVLRRRVPQPFFLRVCRTVLIKVLRFFGM